MRENSRSSIREYFQVFYEKNTSRSSLEDDVHIFYGRRPSIEEDLQVFLGEDFHVFSEESSMPSIEEVLLDWSNKEDLQVFYEKKTYRSFMEKTYRSSMEKTSRFSIK